MTFGLLCDPRIGVNLGLFLMFAIACILGFLIIGATYIALELARPLGEVSELDLEELRADYGRPDPYAPMQRLLNDVDALYLHRQRTSASLQRKLRRKRRRALNLYAHRLRADFSRTCSLCRLLAPIAEDQNFAIRLIRSAILFHCTFLVVNLVLKLGADKLIRVKLSHLARMGSAVRVSAHDLLETAAAWSPAGAPP